MNTGGNASLAFAPPYLRRSSFVTLDTVLDSEREKERIEIIIKKISLIWGYYLISARGGRDLVHLQRTINTLHLTIHTFTILFFF